MTSGLTGMGRWHRSMTNLLHADKRALALWPSQLKQTSDSGRRVYTHRDRRRKRELETLVRQCVVCISPSFRSRLPKASIQVCTNLYIFLGFKMILSISLTDGPPASPRSSLGWGDSTGSILTAPLRMAPRDSSTS